MRAFLAKRPKVAVGLVVVILGAAAGFAYSALTASPPRVENYWYYDLNTGDLFEGPVESYLAIDAPSGPLKNADAAPDIKGRAGVRAHVFSCGACTEGERYIAWLEYHKEEVPYVEGEDETAAQKRYMESHLVRAEDGEKWIISDSEEGQALRTAAYQKCSGKKPTKCIPGVN